MAASVASRSAKVGMSPGSLVHVGERKAREVELRLTVYDGEKVAESSPDPELLPPLTGAKGVVKWLDISGMHDLTPLKKVGELLNVHPLIMEDIANTHQRPKVEFHDGNYVFAVMRMACGDLCEEGGQLEQVSFLLGPGCLVTFRERPGPVFDPVRERLKVPGGRLRRSGADYLMYALLDLLVDQYFVSLESLSDRVEGLEEALIRKPTPQSIIEAHEVMGETAALKRAAWPLREVAQGLLRGDSELITPALQPFLRDLTDHVIQVVELVEAQRETLSGYMDLYLSISSNRMNQTMGFLTVIATIFIPLTFIVGIYGMNFEYMPELKWRYGYAVVWLLMIATGGGMAWWFRKNRWL